MADFDPQAMDDAATEAEDELSNQNEALIWVAEWLGIRQPDGEKPNRADVVRIVTEALAKSKGGLRKWNIQHS